MSTKLTAFTLIEILVVATIIILLTSISVASFSVATQSSRDAKRKGDIETIRQALVLYKTQNGKYPNPSPQCQNPDTGCKSVNELITGGFLSPPFPTDPESTKHYKIVIPVERDKFCVCADVAAGRGNITDAYCETPGVNWVPVGTATGEWYCARQP